MAALVPAAAGGATAGRKGQGQEPEKGEKSTRTERRLVKLCELGGWDEG